MHMKFNLELWDSLFKWWWASGNANHEEGRSCICGLL